MIMMPSAEIECSKIYNDFYGPIGAAHGMIAVVPFVQRRVAEPSRSVARHPLATRSSGPIERAWGPHG